VSPAAPAAADRRPSVPDGLARATATVSALNLVSRLTGFARVVAMSAALGATPLGDAYQSANLVSNILFELLAGGLLASVLVPTFVDLLDRDRRAEAARLAGVLLGVALAGLGAVVVAASLAAPWLMGFLTLGVGDGRADQVELGTFLLWFFLPQMLLYAVGAVATALLHADRRFTAAALAPVCNNVVVIAAMVAFWAVRAGDTTLPLTLGERLLLASGATGGVLAMSIVPLVAVWRRGMALRPRWHPGEPRLRGLVGRGAWAAGHLGVNQLVAMATVVLANGVAGGVVAYQMALTFFLLPYALLANPITTTLYPRLSGRVAGGDRDAFAGELVWGLRVVAFALVPASVLLAALAGPLLDVVRLGALDAAGADLVAATLAAYAAGLVGYGAFFLLTRAAYALDEVRAPTLVNASAAGVGVGAMVAASLLVDGTARLVALGLVHAAIVTAGSVALVRVLRRRLERTLPVLGAVLRDLSWAVVAGVAAIAVVTVVDPATRAASLVALVAGGAIGVVVYLGGQWLVRAPELRAAPVRGRR
jgi:putative peptidoglycan lipid II flippase